MYFFSGTGIRTCDTCGYQKPAEAEAETNTEIKTDSNSNTNTYSSSHHDNDSADVTDNSQKWYYFSTEQGAKEGSLLRNTVTPDNYPVDQDGVWKQ